jgi:hypothetical protein
MREREGRDPVTMRMRSGRWFRLDVPKVGWDIEMGFEGSPCFFEGKKRTRLLERERGGIVHKMKLGQ